MGPNLCRGGVVGDAGEFGTHHGIVAQQPVAALAAHGDHRHLAFQFALLAHEYGQRTQHVEVETARQTPIGCHEQDAHAFDGPTLQEGRQLAGALQAGDVGQDFPGLLAYGRVATTCCWALRILAAETASIALVTLRNILHRTGMIAGGVSRVLTTLSALLYPVLTGCSAAAASRSC